LNLTYENIEKGQVSEAFEVLFPGPIESYKHSTHANGLWNIIKQAASQDYLICIDMSENVNDPNYQKLLQFGLVTNHAYNVIGVRYSSI